MLPFFGIVSPSMHLKRLACTSNFIYLFIYYAFSYQHSMWTVEAWKIQEQDLLHEDLEKQCLISFLLY